MRMIPGVLDYWIIFPREFLSKRYDKQISCLPIFYLCTGFSFLCAISQFPRHLNSLDIFVEPFKFWFLKSDQLNALRIRKYKFEWQHFQIQNNTSLEMVLICPNSTRRVLVNTDDSIEREIRRSEVVKKCFQCSWWHGGVFAILMDRMVPISTEVLWV